MTYQVLLSTDDLSETVPTKINSNFLFRSHLNIAQMTADFTAWVDDAVGSPKDLYSVASAGGTVTVALPDATTGDAAKGRVVTIWKNDAANSVILDPSSAQTINGATSVTLSSQGQYRTIVSDGAMWLVIGNE